MQVRYRIRYKGYQSPIFASTFEALEHAKTQVENLGDIVEITTTMPSGNVFVDIMVSKLNARGDHTWAVRDSRFERRVS